MASAPFKVKAIYEYSSPHDDDLHFPLGQIITVTEEEDADWYVGEYVDASGEKRDGLFPRNFVEKYEPEVPSRPARPARQKQQEAASSAAVPAPVPENLLSQEPQRAVEPTPQPQEEEPEMEPAVQEQARPTPPQPPQPEPTVPATTQEEPVKEQTVKKAPPPISGKSNAFKDRIAAFNKGGAKPIAPMMPGNKPGQASNFIKKPFVPPPPSKNAYVPPVQKQEPVQKPYIREEDPEIRQRQEEDRQAAEAAGFGLRSEPAAPDGEDGEPAPQPQSLKERIALLQKQQAEQAQRRAEGASKPKPKPNPPAKKPSQSSEQITADDNQDLGRVRTNEPSGRQSMDHPRPPIPQEPTSPRPDPPEHEILSDGHDADQSGAGDTTEDDAVNAGYDDSDEIHRRSVDMPIPRATAEAPTQEADVGDEEDTTEGDEGEDDSMDEETRRKEELRARMAKISGGGGFNPFGMPAMPGMAGAIPPKRKSTTKERTKSTAESETTEQESSLPPQRMPMMPVPGMALPGMPQVQSPESETTQRYAEREEGHEPVITDRRESGEVPDIEDVTAAPPSRRSISGAPPVPADRPVPQPSTSQRTVPAPPVPSGRPLPPPPPTEARPIPPAPPGQAAAPKSPGSGSESGDEMSMHQRRSSADMSGADTPLPIRSAPQPISGTNDGAPQPPQPQSPPNRRTSTASYFSTEPSAASSEKRASRAPPPIPTGQPQSPMASPRPPPPPPPTQAPPTRRTTDIPSYDDDKTERGESDYEGDYDTDIASGAKHKDALKAPHAREPSLDDSVTTDENTPMSSPAMRGVPPPPPPVSRPSMDTPRAPPPVPPVSRPSLPVEDEEDDYDPYRYRSNTTTAPIPPQGAAPGPPPRLPEPPQLESSDDLYSTSPPKKSMDRAPPPPPSNQASVAPSLAQQSAPTRPPRQSLDVQRTSTNTRRSGEMGRPSMSGDSGQIAQELDLPISTLWWTSTQPLPPSLQSRDGVDILTEHEESTASKRGGRTTVSKDIYILYMDYSQTIITARYDSKDPADVSLEQRHEPPPPRIRQDQLEAFWQRFGANIAQAVQSAGNKKDPTPLGDGSPQALVRELLKPFQDALLPVGTRAYGAPVYANLANASVMQFDEIRPGDIITLRNAKFEGKHGPMHNKYKQDYGVQHVAVVEEWDGTKKKVRAWEQGRSKAKVRDESFRLGDLRSGEVRVWRIVGREYVGWES